MQLCVLETKIQENRRTKTVYQWSLIPVTQGPPNNGAVALHHLFPETRPRPPSNYKHLLLRQGGYEGITLDIHNKVISQFPRWTIREWIYNYTLKTQKIEFERLGSESKWNLAECGSGINPKKVADAEKELGKIMKKIEDLKQEFEESEQCYSWGELEAHRQQIAELEEQARALRQEKVKRKEQLAYEVSMAEPIAYGILPMDFKEILIPHAPIPILAVRSYCAGRIGFFVLASIVDEEQSEDEEEEEEENEGQ